MFLVIVVKEIRNNIVNLRFTVGIILCAVLTIACVVILTNQYLQEYNDYNTQTMLQDEFFTKYAHTNRLNGVANPPRPPDTFRPLIMGIPSESVVYMSGFFEDPMPVLFPHIDLIFIVTIIMSLLAILFSYDAITGEREDGTLRLIVSNRIKRPILLLGKWVGGTISLFIPFILSLLVGALYIVVHPSIRWDGTAHATFFLLILASMTFISSFYLLGLFMSSISKNSSASILNSLFLWVVLILVIPNLSPYLAAQVYKIPSVTSHERIISRMRSKERDDIGRKLNREVNQKYEREYGEKFKSYLSMNDKTRREQIAANPEFASMVNAYRKEGNEAWNEANRIQNEKARKIVEQFDNRVDMQNKLSKNIACISPFANYLYVATDLTGTGLHGQDYFESVASKYFRSFRDYVDKVTAEAKKKDPLFDSNTYIDISDRPHFSFTEEPIKERLNVVIKYWEILVLFNIVFFVGAYVSFLRYDVR